MPADPVINTVAGAFLVGMLTSLHCAGMCGPWLCAAFPKPSAGYHGGRLLSYTVLGMACGTMGAVPLKSLMHSPLVILPWMLVLVLVSIAVGWKPRIPKPLFARRWHARWMLRHGRSKGFVLGLMTPLLPCGPLYLVLAACLVSGSAWRGGEFALAFTLGTIPLLWIAQASLGRLSLRLGPGKMMLFQRSLALLAALMMIWRLRDTVMPTSLPEGACPMCESSLSAHHE